MPQPHGVRKLLPARDDLRPLYLNTQGLYVGKSNNVLKIKDKQEVVQEVRLSEISQVNLLGNVQLTTQAVQSLCEAEIPIAYFSMGGWFKGMAHGPAHKNIALRIAQYRAALDPVRSLALARDFVAAKVRNCRTLLMRNHPEPPRETIAELLRLEKELLGFYITSHPLAQHDEQLRRFRTHDAGDLAKGGKNGLEARVAGMITNLDVRTANKGRKLGCGMEGG